MQEHKAIYELLYEFRDWINVLEGTLPNKKETVDEFVNRINKTYKIEKRNDQKTRS